MFNSEQLDHMRSLAKRDPADLCYCGWYPLGECPTCTPDLTAADKLALRCPSCGNSPACGRTEFTHVKGCPNK